MRKLLAFYFSLAVYLHGQVIQFDTNSFRYLSGSGLVPSATEKWDSVIHYGADVSGVADSLPAFTNALASVVLSGKVLRVPAGTYLLSGTLTWPDANNISLIGDGMGKSILSFYTGNGILMNTTGTQTNALIAGLTIKGTDPTNRPSYGVLLYDGIKQFRIIDCEFYNLNIGGIVSASTLLTSGWAAKSLVANCYLHVIGPGMSGYISFFGDDSAIVNNVIDDTGGTYQATMHGLYWAHGNNSAIIGNRLVGTNADIQVYETTGYVTNLTMVGNNLKGTHTNPLYQMRNSTITGNTFEDSQVSFVRNTNVVFSGNTCRQQNDVDNYLFFGSVIDGCLITGNVFDGNPSGTTNTVFYGNVGVTRNRVEHNTFMNGYRQFWLNDGVGNVVANNSFMDGTADTAIKVQLDDFGNTIRDNYFYSHSATVTNLFDNSSQPGNRSMNNDWSYGGVLSSAYGSIGTSVQTNTPTAAFLGVNGTLTWASNSVVYISYSTDGLSVTTKQIAP